MIKGLISNDKSSLTFPLTSLVHYTLLKALNFDFEIPLSQISSPAKPKVASTMAFILSTKR